MWVALAEKAYAQFAEAGVTQRDSTTNSYGSIVGGLGFKTMPSISGVAGGFYTIPQPWELFSYWQPADIFNWFNAGRMITFSSRKSGYADNIVPEHEYTLVGYDSSTKKFKLFNPWGVNGGSYNGQSKPGYVDITESEIRQSFAGWSYTV